MSKSVFLSLVQSNFVNIRLPMNFLKSRMMSATVCSASALTIMCRWLLFTTQAYIFSPFCCWQYANDSKMMCLYFGRVKISTQSTTVVVMKYNSSNTLFAIFIFTMFCYYFLLSYSIEFAILLS